MNPAKAFDDPDRLNVSFFLAHVSVRNARYVYLHFSFVFSIPYFKECPTLSNENVTIPAFVFHDVF